MGQNVFSYFMNSFIFEISIIRDSDWEMILNVFYSQVPSTD